MCLVIILPIERVEHIFDPDWREQAERESRAMVAMLACERPPRCRPLLVVNNEPKAH